MKRAGFYARVSTGQQEERGTIASQVAALRDRIVQDSCHLDPDHEFIDDGVSGANLARPELDRLRDLASAGVFEALYVLSPDRLARRYAHQCILLEELTRLGVEVVFLNQAVSDRPEDRLMVQMLGVLAEYEQELIRDRARRGRLYRARQGQVLATTPAYGYRYVPLRQPGGGRWQINEAEAAIVRCIYRWCVDEQLSTYAISQRLNGHQQGYKQVMPRRGERWSYTTVNRILKRTDYKGTAYYNRTSKDPNRPIGQPKIHGRGGLKIDARIEREREEWIAVAVPQIVSSRVWDQAQVQLTLHRRYSSRNNKRHFYLLRGLLVCSHCGRTLAGRTYTNGTIRYCCTNQGHSCRLADPCPGPRVDGKLCEPLIWQAIADLLADPQLILNYYLASQDQRVTKPHELKRVCQELSQIESHKQRLLDAYLAEAIQLDEFETRRQLLDQQAQALQQRRADLEQLAHQQARQDTLTANVNQFCNNINSMLQSPTPQEKQEVLRLVVDQILVEKEQLTIKHVIPLSGDRRLYTQRSTIGILLERALSGKSPLKGR